MQIQTSKLNGAVMVVVAEGGTLTLTQVAGGDSEHDEPVFSSGRTENSDDDEPHVF